MTRTIVSLQPVALAGWATLVLVLGACAVNRSVERTFFQQLPAVTALTLSVQEVPYPDAQDAQAVVNPRAEIHGVIIQWTRFALRDAGLMALFQESIADRGTPLALLEWGTIEGGSHELLLLLDNGIALGGCLLCTSTYYARRDGVESIVREQVSRHEVPEAVMARVRLDVASGSFRSCAHSGVMDGSVAFLTYWRAGQRYIVSAYGLDLTTDICFKYDAMLEHNSPEARDFAMLASSLLTLGAGRSILGIRGLPGPRLNSRDSGDTDRNRDGTEASTVRESR